MARKDLQRESAYDAVVATLGGNIRAARERAGVSRRELSQALQVKEGTTVVADLESDRYKGLRVHRLIAVATRLGVTVDDLIAGVDANYDAMRRDLLGQASTGLLASDDRSPSAQDSPDASARLLPSRFDTIRAELTAIGKSITRLVDDLEDRPGSRRTQQPRPGARRVPKSTHRRSA